MGKTEVARALAAATGARLIRLQCHEGIDLHHAALRLGLRAPAAGDPRGRGRAPTRASCSRRRVPAAAAAARRARARRAGGAADRRDRPRRRRVRGVPARVPRRTSRSRSPSSARSRRAHRPLVVLTSNRTRELHDALKRRCLYHWIDYPTPEREARDRARAPARRARGRSPCACATAVAPAARATELYKLPGVGETIAWAQALLALGRRGRPRGARSAWRSRCTRTSSGCASGGCSRVSERGAVAPTRPARRLAAAHARRAACAVGVGELLAAHRALAAVDSVVAHASAFFALRSVLCSPPRATSSASRRRSAPCFGGARMHDAPTRMSRSARSSGRCCRASAIPARRAPPAPRTRIDARAGRVERRRAAAPQGLRRVHRRRAGAGPRADRPARAARAHAAARRTRAGAPARRDTPDLRRDGARVAALRRRAGGAPLARARRSARGRSCWCATCRARWSPTRGCCSSTCTRAWPRGARVEAFAFGTRLTRDHPRARAGATTTARSRAPPRRCTDFAAARGSAPRSPSSTASTAAASAAARSWWCCPTAGTAASPSSSRREMARLRRCAHRAGVAQPARPRPRLRAAHARDAGGDPAHRPLPAGQLARLAGGAGRPARRRIEMT